MLLVNPTRSGTIWGTWIPWCFPWTQASISDRTEWIILPTWGKILIHIPPFTLFGVLWISLGHSHIYIGTCCCDGLTCWEILTERVFKWGLYTSDYGCILLPYLIKWLPIPFLGLGKARKSVTTLSFSHSFMRSVVACRLGSLLLPTLMMVYLCSIVRWKVLTGTPCIPWLWLIYTLSIGEPQDLTGTTYVQWLHMGCPFSLKILKYLHKYLW